MNKKSLRLITIYFLFILICIGSSSCLSIKELKLFQNLPDSTKLANIKLPKFVSPVIKVGDVISVTVVTNDPTAVLGINSANNAVVASAVGENGAVANANGYLVDNDGNIEMPIIGKIKIENLTIVAAKDVIKARVSEYFTDPIILVRSLSLKVTILGEVQRPGTFTATNEKFTIVDLLAYSGDFTTYARRDNVLLLRKNPDNTMSSIRMDIKKSDILQSPYYYLQNGDVIYVEPNKGKAYANDVVFTRNVSYITLAIGFITTFLSTLLIIKQTH